MTQNHWPIYDPANTQGLQEQVSQEMYALQGLVHITGGGFTENIPRIMPDGLGCSIDTSAWEVPQLFQWLQKVRLLKSRFLIVD